MLETLLMLMLTLTGIFLIMLVLLQRGRGGGLAGAFGGMGGQSAFGTKAGDMFTRITIGVAAVWILLCLFAVKFLGGGRAPVLGTSPASNSATDSKTGEGTPAADDSTEEVPASTTSSGTSSGPARNDASPAGEDTSPAPAATGTSAAPAEIPAAGQTPAEAPATDAGK